jgi:transposase-like protein
MTNKNIRKTHPPKFKTQVVLDMLKEQQTVGQICSHYQVHPSQAHSWKKTVTEGLPNLFIDKRSKLDTAQEELVDELYKQIGEQKVKLDWLKKKLGFVDNREIVFG